MNIFLIYTLTDKDTMLHLLRHLNPLKEVFDLSIWHDDPIISGQSWNTYFESRIHHTNIFLLLISDEFMNSQFISQTEFKAILDKHNENKAVVIPVIIDNCKWDIDLKLNDIGFNLVELEVLPEGGKPIENWDSPDEVKNRIVAGIGRIISLFADNMDKEEIKKDSEKKGTNKSSDEQIEVSITENGETDTEAGEGFETAEEAEAKRRAAIAKRIREEAEASAKRRAEEDRLWEEAMAKRIAENEKRIREEAQALVTGEVEEKNQGEKKQEIEKKAGIEESHEETSGTVTDLRAAQEKIHKEEVEANPYEEEKEERQRKLAAKTHKKAEGVQHRKDTDLKKILLRGSLAIILVVAAIWAFSVFNTGQETEQPLSPMTKEVELEEPDTMENTSIDSINKAKASTKLGIGDIYKGGIIFVLDDANKTGKIAHFEDAGPMPWKSAAEIHEQLGEGWRLPSFDELYLMYQTIGPGATNIGEFADELYWSATDYDEYQARLVRFKDGNTSYHYNKNVEQRKFMVRAIRDLR